MMVYAKNATIANVYNGITIPMPLAFCCGWRTDPAPIGGRIPGNGPG